jgi:asparagine synthetase B (glutamine-hydrolysing)
MQDVVPERMRRLTLTQQNLDEALQLWHEDGLTNLLQYGDAISMSVNLETRCPFLDYRLVELGFSMRGSLLVNQGYGKHILRLVGNDRLPAEIVWSRAKRGFSNSTVRGLRRIVERNELPPRWWDLAVQLGLVCSMPRQERMLNRLPDSVLFRVVSLLAWADAFYGPEAPWSTQHAQLETRHSSGGMH